MVEICDICGKEIQNAQALRIHRLSCKKANELASSSLTKEKPDTDGSVNSLSEPSDDLEIEEAEIEEVEENNNFCPECNCKLKDYENPCPNCGAEIEWGE